MMLQNISRAKYTVIHDLNLVNILWTDSGVAAVAITLSTWFMRGWTAAELNANQWKELSAKVLFRNSNPEIPDPAIKDLQQDIPPFSPGALPDPAHLNAAQVIQEVLEPVDVDTDRTTPNLTRAALTHFTYIPKTALFHDKAPMAAYGGWSWCPSSVFDLDNLGHSVTHISAADIQDYERVPLYISPEAPTLPCRPKIGDALETLETCLLLKVNQPPDGSNVATGLLVQPVDGQSTASRWSAEAGKVAAHCLADDPWAKGRT
ncbi:hypothetical protein DL769_005283 [Monosporascus sp. CRB-8-3]|nr:hypothetical protein DL769_005283 [Monosporascus sp. CRB-8-3]